MTRIGACRIAAEILGQALLDLATQLTDEPDLKSPVAQMPDYQASGGVAAPSGVFPSVVRQIGLGGNGADRSYPECRVCYARGGGGHGGFCPNSGKKVSLWVTVPPPGFLLPNYPADREPW